VLLDLFYAGFVWTVDVFSGDSGINLSVAWCYIKASTVGQRHVETILISSCTAVCGRNKDAYQSSLHSQGLRKRLPPLGVSRNYVT